MKKERKGGFRFVLFASVSIALLAIDSKSIGLHQVRSVLFAITKPLVEVAEVPAAVRLALEYALEDRERIMERNREVAEENAQLRHRIIQLESSEQHAKWLGDLLSASEQLDAPVMLASLKSIGLSPADQRVVISRGADDGAFVGQAVLDFRGVLGQISEVARTESAVTLITHASHSIPVRVRRTGLLAFANGLGNSVRMSVPYLAGQPDIRVGDVLVTSGLGERFPMGFPVAEVTSVVQERNEPFAEVFARPYAAIDYGYDVLLVMKPDLTEPDSNAEVSMNESS